MSVLPLTDRPGSADQLVTFDVPGGYRWRIDGDGEGDSAAGATEAEAEPSHRTAPGAVHPAQGRGPKGAARRPKWGGATNPPTIPGHGFRGRKNTVRQRFSKQSYEGELSAFFREFGSISATSHFGEGLLCRRFIMCFSRLWVLNGFRSPGHGTQDGP